MTKYKEMYSEVILYYIQEQVNRKKILAQVHKKFPNYTI